MGTDLVQLNCSFANDAAALGTKLEALSSKRRGADEVVTACFDGVAAVLAEAIAAGGAAGDTTAASTVQGAAAAAAVAAGGVVGVEESVRADSAAAVDGSNGDSSGGGGDDGSGRRRVDVWSAELRYRQALATLAAADRALATQVPGRVELRATVEGAASMPERVGGKKCATPL